jgi:hypothetical protein
MHGTRARVTATLAALAFALFTAPAFATFHLYRIQQIYSNADGTIQFAVLKESFGADGENLWKDHAISSGGPGGVQTFVFPNNLPRFATANTYVLVATEGFRALGIVTPDFVVPNHFFTIGPGNLNFADVDFISYAGLPTDGVSALDRNKNAVPNVARNFAGQSASVTAAMVGGGGAVAKNYQGLWWNAPADSESGWGINLTHQGDIIFATWFTYDTAGKAWWVAMTANKTADATYSGVLFDAAGPAFSAVPFDSTKFKPTAVGNGTLHFTDENNGTFNYTVNGVTQAKTITRQSFGPLPTCLSATQVNPVAATNYQDLWWNAPADSESGWGINLTHQGDVIFATWFTYDAAGKSWWLAMAATKTATATYSGDLFDATGPAFSAVPFDSSKFKPTGVGKGTLHFTDGSNGTFSYTVNGTTQTKTITRQVFATPTTVCQ